MSDYASPGLNRRPDRDREAKQNAEHRAGPNKNTTSGVRGVSWRSDMRKWGATVGHEGKRIRLGHFATIAEAEAAVLAKRRELFTHNDADR
ncbi:AP2 domain-containing protein [Paenarthrobacter sp. JL.01a]|uniref:AP2 domain-containing protein n=1 Tax=Paenarthrobacter sp. JL.01a TaxID=2979324 RepID=UPI0021CA597C|nr:AP2 domain-containing protein [Paenarthrobacter sp. JL.01a]UXM90930.1 AP2 domain-containing protein [Paenarthrobacter sp. JL.01a]